MGFQPFKDDPARSSGIGTTRIGTTLGAINTCSRM